jgi:hypothetical protein
MCAVGKKLQESPLESLSCLALQITTSIFNTLCPICAQLFALTTCHQFNITGGSTLCGKWRLSPVQSLVLRCHAARWTP